MKIGEIFQFDKVKHIGNCDSFSIRKENITGLLGALILPAFTSEVFY